jgi:exopolyphosphatase / guanosine-5'-triphosphate,3'-diphosphate pyrophosphatase
MIAEPTPGILERASGQGRSRRVAVLDLGSTTFQLLVADATDDGWLTPVLRDRVVLNLGLVLGGQGEIPPDVAERAGTTARRLRDIAIRSGAEQVIAIATSALRETPNRDRLEALLADALGEPVRFIDGREEARLTAAGIHASLALPPGPALLLDLGGGSLEIALTDADGLRWGMSLPIGAGRLTGLLVHHDRPSREERKAVRRRVEEEVEPVLERTRDLGVTWAVASGGTAGALARLLVARTWSQAPASLNQHTVRVEALKALANELGSLTLAQRLKLPGIDERRAELLPAGGWILTTAASLLGVTELIHSEWGLREGVVLDELGVADRPASDAGDLRARSVAHVIGSAFDATHLEIVARLSGELFDGLAPLHELGPLERELLVHAARLHEVGASISPAKYHKHGAYLIQNGGLRGFTPEEVAMLSSIVRFHRGKDPRPVYPPFADLDASRQAAVVALTSILRVAHAIGRGDEPDDLGIETRVRPRAIRIRVTGSTHPTAVVEEALEVSELLSRTFDREVDVETRDRHEAA